MGLLLLPKYVSFQAPQFFSKSRIYPSELACFLRKRKEREKKKKSPHSLERRSGIKLCEEGNVSWHPGWVQERHWQWDKAESVCSQTPPRAGKKHARGLQGQSLRGGGSWFTPSRMAEHAWVLHWGGLSRKSTLTEQQRGSRQRGMRSLPAGHPLRGQRERSRPTLREPGYF